MPASLPAHEASSEADADLKSALLHEQRLAAPMFYITLGFLAVVAGLVVCWIDIPRVVELAQTEAGSVSVQTVELLHSSQRVGRLLLAVLLLLWPLYIMEFLHRQWHARKHGRLAPVVHGLLVCLIPPLRLGLGSAVNQKRLWLPGLAWRNRGKALSKKLQQLTGKPMLLIAFLILPVLAVEFLFASLLENLTWLRVAVHVATGFIWWCFACEFIIMVNATDKKFAYIKKNWIDLVIILLPLVSFLRTIRVLRLARLAKVQQITKMTRMYRIKGIAGKASRALLLMPFLNRLLRITPERRLQKLIETREDKRIELADIDSKIEALRAQQEKSVTAS